MNKDANRDFIHVLIRQYDENASRESLDELEKIIISCGIVVRRVREIQEAQDFGSVLEILLNSSAVITLAWGLRGFVTKRGSAITIETSSGKVQITGDPAKRADVTAIVAALTNAKPLVERSVSSTVKDDK